MILTFVAAVLVPFHFLVGAISAPAIPSPTVLFIDPLYIVAAAFIVNLAMIGLKREHWATNTTKTLTIILNAAGSFIAVLASRENVNPTLVLGTFFGTLGFNQATYALALKNTKLGTWIANWFTPTAAQQASQAGLAATLAATMVQVTPVATDPASPAVDPATSAPATDPATAPAAAPVAATTA